ncbi:MAG: Holliday junction branch migration protein RuvA [Synergistaceae bacterium]|nr:Holliday junction branch migration protein RuvA [Synergistaceae bacterium]
MLRILTGEVLDISENYIVLDVNGLGFEILCSQSALNLCELNKRVRLVVYLQISEAGASLFGFDSERERKIFLKIISIKGIGGKSAMAVLSTLNINEILNAVASSDALAFTRVPGIGRKTAERLCFELKNILKDDLIININTEDVNNNKAGAVSTVSDALISLGFSQADIAGAFKLLRAARGDEFNNLSEEDLLRLALKELNKF